ncbi:ribosome biogenesis GTPase [Neisseria sp. HSC-16F19]|nr:ribosome small subunit-dependent GTPase A [Neisseria sp. HSC-16F19]MCP2040041.1 ribosome biogenesis GTPase [Neisseria sp. HSC-16F19]
MAEIRAQIIASYGRRYVVRCDDGRVFDASTRKKRVDFACGDWVDIQVLNHEQAVIEDYRERHSLLYRQDAHKSKLIAANVTQLFIVTAAVPTPSEMLLQRALLAAEAADIRAVIVLNKSDLPQSAALAEQLSFYRSLGYTLLSVSALADVGALREEMQGETNILLGQSGMGKSTLTNALLGGDYARVGDISTALDSGRHTTTHAQLYDLDADTQLIDSPGLQAFGLHHLQAEDLAHYCPDMREFIGLCRFHNCSHRREPDCAFKAAAVAGEIRPQRLAFLQSVIDELAG